MMDKKKLNVMNKKELNIMDKKELEFMELDNVSGGSWWDDSMDIVEEVYDTVNPL